MKKIFTFLTFLLFSAAFFNLHAYQGIMNGYEGKLKIAKTRYFDIIYAPESEKSADILYKNADRLYDELREKYMVKYPFRITVTVSPGTDDFNALFSCFPYNSIVIFDTAPSQDMMVFSQTLLNTFRHELIHAITYNSKNAIWHGIGSIFGDVVNPAVLTTTMAFAEGATVSTESDGGEGRMNSDYHLMMVKQAKIEGKFPKYSEIQGARDIFPGGQASYYFGGAFSEYLQKTYGMEKYAQFWYNATNIQKFSYLFYFSNFKKVYGLSFEKAWKDFYDSIEVPKIDADPTKSELCSPLEKLLKNPGSMNKGKNYYSCLTSCQKGFAWYDNTDLSLYFSDNQGKVKKITRQSGVSRLSLSPDGRFLAISYTKDLPNTSINHVKILDLERKFSFELKTSKKDQLNPVKNGKKPAFRDAAIFMNEDQYYVAAVKTLSQNTSLEVFKINSKKTGDASLKESNLSLEEGRSNLKDAGASLKEGDASKKYAKSRFTHLASINADFGNIIFSPCGNQEGKLFYLYKDGLDFQLHLWDMKAGKISRLEAEIFSQKEDRSVLRDLNCQENLLTFSYTQKGTFPRLGIIEIPESEWDISKNQLNIRLFEKDISGGIYNPVKIQLEENTKESNSSDFNIAFTGIFFEHRRLLTLKRENTEFREIKAGFSEYKKDEKETKISLTENLPSEEASQSEMEEITLKENLLAEPAEQADQNKESISQKSKKYSSLAYTFTGQNGIFIPASIAQVAGIQEDSEGNHWVTAQFSLPFGASYISSSPWTDPVWYLSMGYLPLVNNYALTGMMQGSNKISKYNLNQSLSFDSYGFKNSYTSAAFTIPLTFWGDWYLNIQDSSDFFYGRQSEEIPEIILKNTSAEDTETLKDLAEYLSGYFMDKSHYKRLYSSTIAGLAFGNISARGQGTYENGGIQIMPFWTNSDFCIWQEGEHLDFADSFYFNLGLDLTAAIPRLLPFESYKKTLNLPMQINATLFPPSGETLKAEARMLLFSSEVQKSTNKLPLFYFNRWSISSSYEGKFKEKEKLPSYAIFDSPKYFKNIFEGKDIYNDQLSLFLTFDFTPNIGGLARSAFKFQVDAGLHYRFNPEKDQDNFGFSLMGISIF